MSDSKEILADQFSFMFYVIACVTTVLLILILLCKFGEWAAVINVSLPSFSVSLIENSVWGSVSCGRIVAIIRLSEREIFSRVLSLGS